MQHIGRWCPKLMLTLPQNYVNAHMMLKMLHVRIDDQNCSASACDHQKCSMYTNDAVLYKMLVPGNAAHIYSMMFPPQKKCCLDRELTRFWDTAYDILLQKCLERRTHTLQWSWDAHLLLLYFHWHSNRRQLQVISFHCLKSLSADLSKTKTYLCFKTGWTILTDFYFWLQSALLNAFFPES